MLIDKPANHKVIGLMPKVKLLHTWVNTGSYASFLNRIIQLGASQESSYVCFANVHMMMEIRQDPGYQQIVKQATLVAPDGRPLSILMNKLYGVKQERVCGMDVLPDLLALAEQQQLSVFFYGSTTEVLNSIRNKALHDFPLLQIAGFYSPPFRNLSAEEDRKITDMINSSGARLIFVSLGCPKQEKWMHDHQGRIHGCMLGVGQAFLTFAGLEKRLPPWARNLSLEWLYRLYLEPRRLWKRYLIGNSLFLYQAAKCLLLQTGKPKPSAASQA